MEQIAEKIKNKRYKLGMTQKELADVLKMGKNGDRTIRRWENCESSPSAIELEHILQLSENPTFPDQSLEEARFTTIDLFAGIGGIRLGFQEYNSKTVFSSEWDKFAQKTYKANFGEVPKGDITQIEMDEIPEHDILLAGFPCQPFSQAGLKRGFEDTRGTLFYHIAKILEAKRPKAFMLENVKQLRGHDRGRTFQTIKQILEDLDYTVYTEVLRAADFGVPQNRERIFIVGFDNKLGGLIVPFKFPKTKKIKTSVGDILEKNLSKIQIEKYTISDKLYNGHLRRKEMHQKKGNGFGFSIFNEYSEYTNTLSARYYKDGSEILIEQEGENPRKLTPRECARLQGFPENFCIPVSDSQAYRQFGNSVAVPVVRAVAGEMIIAMEQSGMLPRGRNNYSNDLISTY